MGFGREKNKRMFTKEEKEKAQYFKFSLHPLEELEYFLKPRFLSVIDQDTSLNNTKILQTMIPKQILLFWHDAIPSGEVQKSIDKIRQYNDGYQVILFNEQSAGEFIQRHYGQDLYRLYERRCVHPSMKSDLFRMCYLALNGGVYVDIDINCHHSLKEIFNTYSFDCFLFFSRGKPCCIDNDFIVCQPNNPIILASIEKIRENLTIERSFSSVWECTGPGAVSMAVLELLMQKILSDNEEKSPLGGLLLGCHDLAKRAYGHVEMEYKKTAAGNWRSFHFPRQLCQL